MRGACNLCSQRWKTISASSAPPALYYQNCNACSTVGKRYRRTRGLWTSIRSSDPPCPPQAAELSLLRTLPPKIQLPWGPQVAPLVNQSRKRPQVALLENRSRKTDGLAGSPPCMGSCNIFHSGCNMTTTITGGTHSTLWVTFLRPGLAAGYALMPMQ